MLPVFNLPVQSEKAHYRLVMGFRNAERRSQSRRGTANLVFKEEEFMGSNEFFELYWRTVEKSLHKWNRQYCRFLYEKGASTTLGTLLADG